MPRFYLPAGIAADTFSLPEHTVRHIRALRLDNGAEITLFDGSGSEYAARLVIAGKRAMFAEILQKHTVSRESPLHTLLIQGVSVGERMDFTVQKATELGVGTILPVIGAHSAVRLKDARAEKRTARWQEIAAAACEQCGRNILPQILPVQTLPEALATLPETGAKLLFSPAENAKILREIPFCGNVLCLAVGAEGGFSPEENAALLQAAFTPVSLGARVLRTETAAAAALAAVQALWGG